MKKRRSRGRPPLPKRKKKRHFVAIKLDDTEWDLLKKKAKEKEISRTEVVREGLKLILGMS